MKDTNRKGSAAIELAETRTSTPYLAKDQPRRLVGRTNGRKLVMALILVLSLQVCVAAEEKTTAETGNSGSTQPTQAELDAQKRRLEREADALEQARKNCEVILDEIKNVKEPDSAKEDKSTEVALLAAKLANAQAQYTEFTDPRKPPADFGKAVTELAEAARAVRFGLMTLADDLSEEEELLDEEQLRTLPRPLARKLSGKGHGRTAIAKPSSDKVERLVIGLKSFLQGPDAAHLKTGPQSLLPSFDEATKQVASLPEAIKKYLGQVSAARTALLREDQTLVETEIKGLKEAEKANQDQQNRLLKQLGTLEQQQTYLDSRLMYILLCMMGTVLAMLVILRWRGDRVSELIVRERTAVEILSIGMFLSTIMYLSAARYIEKTILGTLLGTLAGYLFTRRSGQSLMPDETVPAPVPAPAPVPGTPSLPKFDATTNTLSLSALPPRTDFLKVFFRDTTTGTNEELGTTKTKEFVIPAGKLTSGKTYELFFAASNATGDSKPGPALKVSVP